MYDEPKNVRHANARSKVESQFARAEHYVEAVNATVVVPSAGPPCFLDDDLFGYNMITGDEISIFPDQSRFSERLRAKNRATAVNVPGTTIEVALGEVRVKHPGSDADAPFSDKLAYLREYQRDWQQWLDDEKSSWPAKTSAFQPRLAAWWEPLLQRAPKLR
ncbi:MAG: (2Fe-2S)-binding protein, partial [Actinomycetota bacterium]